MLCVCVYFLLFLLYSRSGVLLVWCLTSETELAAAARGFSDGVSQLVDETLTAILVRFLDDEVPNHPAIVVVA